MDTNKIQPRDRPAGQAEKANALLTDEIQSASPPNTNVVFLFSVTPTVDPQERAVAWLLDYLGGDGSPGWPGIKEYQASHAIEKIANILMLKPLG